MKVNSIWPTHIGVSERPVEDCKDHMEIYTLIRKLEKEQSIDNGEGLGFVTDGTIHQYDELHRLNKWLIKQVHDFCEQVGWDVDIEDIFIANSWAVLSKNGASTHKPHIHANTLLSSVYYLNAPEGSAPLGLLKPDFKWESWQPDFKERTSITEGEYYVPAKTGQCVVFRSSIPHMTGQNSFSNTNELQERVVIPYTFNIKNLGKKSRGRHYGI
jgi:uncharacterized protein (TIGR02466 family)